MNRSRCPASFWLLTCWAFLSIPSFRWQPPGPASGPLWPQQALVHMKCPVFLAWRLCPDGRMDESWKVPVLHFLLAAHLSSTLGGLSRKPKCPLWPLTPILAHMVGIWATSWVIILRGRGLLFPPRWSSTLPAGQQMHLPMDPTLGDHVCSCGRLTSPLPSTQIQQHTRTSFGEWMGSVVPCYPNGDIHQGIPLHLGSILPHRWIVCFLLPAP